MLLPKVARPRQIHNRDRKALHMRAKKYFFLLFVSILGLALVACERKSISEIRADPGRFMNKEVAVVGKVTQSHGFLGKGIYQVDDGTGTLWVISETRGVPSTGAKVGVKGHIIPTITFMGVNYATVLQESGRRAG